MQTLLANDEIDFGKIVKTILKYKILILITSFSLTFVMFVKLIYTPNIYQSKMTLSSVEESKSGASSKLGALASIANVQIGSDDVSSFDYLKTILSDQAFHFKVIQKYNLIEKLNIKTQDMVFVFGGNILYDIFHSNTEYKSKEESLYSTFKSIKNMMNLSQDRKTSIITFAFSSPDRKLAKELVNIYIKEATQSMKNNDAIQREKQIKYYQDKIRFSNSVELKTTISNMLSSLIQKQILSQSSTFYTFKQITEPGISYIKAKIGPNRSLKLILTLFLSFIFTSILALIYDYRKTKKQNDI